MTESKLIQVKCRVFTAGWVVGFFCGQLFVFTVYALGK